MPKSYLETIVLVQIEQANIVAPDTEYRFSAPRKWRFDLAWPNLMLAVEVEGGVHSRGRHTRPAGYEKDCEKYNSAILLGWRVLRVTSKHIMSGEALLWIEQAIGMTDTTNNTTKTL